VLEVTGNFDGGNPQDQEYILPIGENGYSIFPYSEDEDPVYKFRLDLKIKKQAAEEGRLLLLFDWKDERYIQYRSRLYLKSPGRDWNGLDGKVEGSTITLSFSPPPGETYVTLNPKYDYRDYLTLVTRCANSERFMTQLLYTTEGGKELWMVESRQGDEQMKILVTARAHPYETGGSYCVDGFLEHLLEDGGMRHFPKFFVLPMLSPDGVCDGLCKLSAKNGEDIARSSNRENPMVDSLFSLVDKVQPHFILDFHSWMLPNENGLYYEKPGWMKTFARLMKKKGHCDRGWRLGTQRRFFAQPPSGMKWYAKQRFGTRCMTVEYPWFERTVPSMKSLGIDTVMSVIEMLTT
jgi:hypothetical protein